MRTQRNGSLALALSLNLFLAVAGLAGCSGSKCADGSCAESASGFELQSCKTDSDCKDGLACLPERCDGTCVPDAAGACQACPAEGSGLCMPRSSDSGTAPVTPACFAGRLGDPAACGVDVDWGRKAVDTCTGQRAELIDLHALLTCADGRPSGVVFTCCSWDGGTADGGTSDGGTAGEPPVTDPTVTDPAADACVSLTVRVDVMSTDPAFADPKMAAEEQCRAMGLELRDVQVQPDSAGAPPAVATATCCKAGAVQPPADDPQACQQIPIPGDPNVEPKEMAVRICNDQHLVLTDLKPLDVAPDGTILAWMASCCGAAAQPPATDPTTPDGCVAVPVKVDPASPDPMYSDPKMGAYEQCRAMGLELRDVQFQPDSSGAPSAVATATCCKAGAVQPPADDPQACQEIPIPGAPGVDPKEMALKMCQGQNLALTDVKALDVAADGNVFTWLATCCGTPAQPPATDPTTPEGCVAVPVKVDPANPDPMYNDPKMGAYEQCRAMGLELRDLQSDLDDAGVPTLWTATCCKPASVEPPADDPSTPAAACTDLPVGDGTCDATLDLKGQALQRCQDLGATLKDLRVRFTCADGTVGALIATCCR